MAAIEAQDLLFEHAPGRGVTGLSLKVESGTCFGLLGPNGCGKTTLTGLLIGLHRPARGGLTVLGRTPTPAPAKNLARIGVLLDNSPAYEDLSGQANAVLCARIRGAGSGEAGQRVAALARAFGLEGRMGERVRTYSLGMRRKLGLIQALTPDPELLVLDEPTAGLDAQGMETLAGLIRKRTRTGRTTWIATNQPDWVERIADRAGFMEGGRIVAQGPPKELIQAVGRTQEVRIAGQDLPLEGPELEGLLSWTLESGSLTAILEDDPELVPVLLEALVKAGTKISSVRIAGPTLKDAFLLATGRSLEE